MGFSRVVYFDTAEEQDVGTGCRWVIEAIFGSFLGHEHQARVGFAVSVADGGLTCAGNEVDEVVTVESESVAGVSSAGETPFDVVLAVGIVDGEAVVGCCCGVIIVGVEYERALVLYVYDAGTGDFHDFAAVGAYFRVVYIHRYLRQCVLEGQRHRIAGSCSELHAVIGDYKVRLCFARIFQRSYGCEIPNLDIVCRYCGTYVRDRVECPEPDVLHVGCPVVLFVEYESALCVVPFGDITIDEQVIPVVDVGIYLEPLLASFKNIKGGFCSARHAGGELDLVACGRNYLRLFVRAGCDGESCGYGRRKQLES